MDAQIKHKWVKALRSGEYAQMQKCLSEDQAGGGRLCCLGILHYKVSSRVGIVELDELPANIKGQLIDMNDSGSTFLEIADFIESHL